MNQLSSHIFHLFARLKVKLLPTSYISNDLFWIVVWKQNKYLTQKPTCMSLLENEPNIRFRDEYSAHLLFPRFMILLISLYVQEVTYFGQIGLIIASKTAGKVYNL